MQVTFCDRHKAMGQTVECVNGVCIVYMRVIHRTAQGEWVGEDETKPRELCHECGEWARTQLGMEMDETPERSENEMRALRLLSRPAP